MDNKRVSMKNFNWTNANIFFKTRQDARLLAKVLSMNGLKTCVHDAGHGKIDRFYVTITKGE